MKKTALKWEFFGFLWIVILGSLVHFAYEWSGFWRPLAVVTPVNESVWEHLKMSFWPGLLFGIVQHFLIRHKVNNLWAARSLGLLTTDVAIVGLFYGYVVVLGHHSLITDILVFVVSVILGQLVSYRLLTANILTRTVQGIAVAGLVAMVVAFSTLSFYPPRIPLFEDSQTGGYGIPVVDQSG